MNERRELGYSFAVLRVVPHVHIGTFYNVGVVVHERTTDYLGVRVIEDADELARRIPDVDAPLLARYLCTCRLIGEGDAAAGPVALAPSSERFHWLTAPRSDVLQSSPVHEGVGADPARALDEIFDELVAP